MYSRPRMRPRITTVVCPGIKLTGTTRRSWAGWTTALARATGVQVHERGFDAALFVGEHGAPLDFSLHASMDHASGHAYTRSPKAFAVPRAPLLAWLWKEAVEEWQ